MEIISHSVYIGLWPPSRIRITIRRIRTRRISLDHRAVAGTSLDRLENDHLATRETIERFLQG
jgi:hypothetical protein